MKSEYGVKPISKAECVSLLKEYHYLSKISKGFKSGENFGLTYRGHVVGVCIFTGFPVPELAKGCFGLERDDQKGLFELSRLVVHPAVQYAEHNITSWFVSRAIKMLKRRTKVRAILSYADNDQHKGIIYRACNFEYYGMAAAKNDYWVVDRYGHYSKLSRGRTTGVPGEWRPRSRKHRFLMTFDKRLTCRWDIVNWTNTVT